MHKLVGEHSTEGQKEGGEQERGGTRMSARWIKEGHKVKIKAYKRWIISPKCRTCKDIALYITYEIKTLCFKVYWP